MAHTPVGVRPSTGRRRQAMVAVLFLLFAVVELWTPITHGGWYFPGDDGQFWTLTAVGSAPPQNGLTGDVYEGIVPFLGVDIAALRSGQIPTWNPANGNGQPFLANGQSAVFSPFTLVYVVVGLHAGLVLTALVKLWILGFVSYLVLRRRGLHDLAAAVGGAVFAYAGYHLVWLQFQNIVSVSALLPVALWCADLAVAPGPAASGEGVRRRARILAAAGLALVLGAMGLSGHPETLLFDGLLTAAFAVYVAWRTQPDLRSALGRLAPLAGAGVLGIGLAAVQLVPFWQYEGQSARAATTRASAHQVVPGFPLDTLPMVAFPDLFGGPQYHYLDPALYQVHERSNYAEVNGTSIGLTGLCLVCAGVAAVAWRRRDDHSAARRALGIFCLGAVVVDGLLLYIGAVGTLWWHLPALGSAVLNRSQDIALFGAAGLSGVAVDWLIRAGGDRRPRAATAAAVFVVVGAATTLGALALRRRLLGAGAGRLGADLVRTHVLSEVGMAAALLLVLVLVALGTAALRGTAGLAGVALCFGGNGLVMRSFNPAVGGAQVYPVTPALAAVRAVTTDQETLFADASFPWADVNLRYAMSDVGSFDPLDYAWQADLYRRVFKTRSAGETERLPTCIGGLQAFGVQWVVGGNGRLADGTSLPLEATHGGVPVYRVPDSGPLAVATSAAVMGDATAMADLADCHVDPTTTVALAPSPAFGPQDHEGRAASPGASVITSARATFDVRSATDARVRVSAPGPAWLVVRQTWAPGWRATVDGRPTPLRRADVAFDAVAVPAGTHVVELSYHPSSFTAGVAGSLASLVALAAGVVLCARPRRLRPGQAPPVEVGRPRSSS